MHRKTTAFLALLMLLCHRRLKSTSRESRQLDVPTTVPQRNTPLENVDQRIPSLITATPVIATAAGSSLNSGSAERFVGKILKE
jgi:hypothetical protein